MFSSSAFVNGFSPSASCHCYIKST